jgi:hypothetical protein
MNNDPDKTAVERKTDPFLVAGFITALTALTDWLLRSHPLGWTAGVYAGALLAVVLTRRHFRQLSRVGLLLALVVTALCLRWLGSRDPRNEDTTVCDDTSSDLSEDPCGASGTWRGWTFQCSLRKEEPTEQAEDRFSFGKVVSVSRREVVIREYDFTQDREHDTHYIVPPQTELGNINSLSELKKADDVVMDYILTDGRRTITTLVREAPTPEPPPDTLVSPTPDAPPPAESSAVMMTGSVVALRPGRIRIRQPGGTVGAFTNQDYVIARRAELRGLATLTDLRIDQCVAFRFLVSEGKPTIVELAIPGFNLTDELQ